MVKYLKFLTSILMINGLFSSQNAFSIDVVPEGRLIRNHQVISKNPTVQMYFSANNPPVINVTPGRHTIVQFPSEVRSCSSSTNLISLTYGDQVTAVAPQVGVWYSALILNANGGAISKMNAESLLNIPSTDVTCQIRISNPNSQQTESYAWKIIGVKIARPEETYIVVYLLDETTPIGSSGLPSEEELMASGESYVDMNKLGDLFHKAQGQKRKQDKGRENKKEPQKEDEFPSPGDQKAILTDNLNLNKKEENSLSKIYNFSSSKERPPNPKLN